MKGKGGKETRGMGSSKKMKGKRDGRSTTWIRTWSGNEIEAGEAG